jgi:hypothetical protein
MRNRSRWIAAILLTALAFASLEAAATVTRQNADAFSKKVALIRRQSEGGSRAARRTALTQDELNSWLAYQSQPHLPTGVSAPEVTIVGQGRLSGNAVVDLEAIGRHTRPVEPGRRTRARDGCGHPSYTRRHGPV